MTSLSFDSPGLLDAILGLVVLEGALVSMFLIRHRVLGLIGPLVLYLASGAGLLAALRFAVSEMPSVWIATALSVSLVAHIGTLRAARGLVMHEPSAQTLRGANARAAGRP